MADQEFPIKTDNEFAVHKGENLPNHTVSMNGFPKFVKIGDVQNATLRTRQQAYRLCAYILSMAILLPDEDGSHSFEEVQEAIQNA